MLELYEGRPIDKRDRLPVELRTYDFLDALGIPYQRVDHAPAMTMEACAEIDRSLGFDICKNLFLCNRQGTVFYLLLMPAKKKFKTRDLSARLGVSRLSFADAQHMETLLGLTPGSVSVLGLMNDQENQVRLVIDEEIVSEEWFGCHPCMNTSTIRFPMRTLLETILPALHHTPTFVQLPSDPGAEAD